MTTRRLFLRLSGAFFTQTRIIRNGVLLETERLIIRRFRSDDSKDLHEYLSQEETVQYEPYDIFTEEESKQEALNRSGNDAFWADNKRNFPKARAYALLLKAHVGEFGGADVVWEVVEELELDISVT